MGNNSFDFCIGTANHALKKSTSSMLKEAGFYSTGDRQNIPDFLRLLRTNQPWLAVIDTQLPPGNVKQLASIIEEDGLAAALYINTDYSNLDGYMSLKWPVETAVLAAVARALCVEFRNKKNLHDKIKGLENRLNNRKAIDKAKGIIMQQKSLSEERAHRYLQKKSMEKRTSMIDMALRIITGKDGASF